MITNPVDTLANACYIQTAPPFSKPAVFWTWDVMSGEPTSAAQLALLAPAPILQAPIALEGTDSTLATEILPPPPPISYFQPPPTKHKGELKRPLPSFLPSKDPGSTYGNSFSGAAAAAAPGTDEKGRRKRAKIDKTYVPRMPGR